VIPPPPDPQLWYPGWPVVVESREGRARCLVATRALTPDEPVLFSTPYAWAPGDRCYERVCHYCCRDKLDVGAPCRFYCDGCCRAWYCSEDCRALDQAQHRFECSALDHCLRSSHWQDPDSRGELRLLLRLLSRRALEIGSRAPDLAFALSPAKPSNEGDLRFDDFMLLASNRHAHEEELMRQLYTTANLARSLDRWLEAVDSHVIFECLLRIRTNTFAITNASGLRVGSGLYIQASLFNHSCQPNLTYRRAATGANLEFTALGDIPVGTELTISYVSSEKLEERRAWLLQSHFFLCACERCCAEERNRETAKHSLADADRASSQP
jgi:hypothetical protein